MATRRVTEVGLQVAPELLGAELASPARRLAAFVIDVALLFVPSVLVAVAVAWATLAVREPAALNALMGLMRGSFTTPAEQRAAMRDLIPLLVLYDMPGTPPEVAVAWREGRPDQALEALGDRDILVVLDAGLSAPVPVGQVRVDLGRLMPAGVRLAALYGLAALYFSWLTSRSSGATLGKRWLGIRVTRIAGGRVGLEMSFERFVGYAQVPGSLFTALLDLWRDRNRRLPHDRLAGTLVVRTGREAAARPPRAEGDAAPDATQTA